MQQIRKKSSQAGKIYGGAVPSQSNRQSTGKLYYQSGNRMKSLPKGLQFGNARFYYFMTVNPNEYILRGFASRTNKNATLKIGVRNDLNKAIVAEFINAQGKWEKKLLINKQVKIFQNQKKAFLEAKDRLAVRPPSRKKREDTPTATKSARKSEGKKPSSRTSSTSVSLTNGLVSFSTTKRTRNIFVNTKGHLVVMSESPKGRFVGHAGAKDETDFRRVHAEKGFHLPKFERKKASVPFSGEKPKRITLRRIK